MQDKARQEVLEIMPSKDTELSFELLDSLKYTNAFIKESLRFFPTVPINGRFNRKECKFGDYIIPKGSHISFRAATINFDPDQFDFPNEFIPERYLEGSK